MHLLVLSAFRPLEDAVAAAPEGLSQCTFWCSVLSDAANYDLLMQVGVSQCTFWCSVLSDFNPTDVQADVDFTSQCTFWCSVLSDWGVLASLRVRRQVSMHLLVLSAFRLLPQKTAPQRRLLERNRRRHGKHHIESARTRPIKPHNREKPPQTTPAPPTPPTSRYATGFQRTQAKKPTPHDYARVNFVLLGVQNPLLQSDAYFASKKTDTGLH